MSQCKDMSCQSVQTGCKINLCLQITGVRPNGYHELDSLFYPLPKPFDILYFFRTPAQKQGQDQGLHIECACPGIDLQNNTLTRAYTAYAKRTGYAPPLTIRLKKGIPHGAGLGGGSADAAVVLQYLNAHAPTPLDTAALLAIGATVGADVPFFLQTAPCRVTGIGEKLAPLPFFLTGWNIVLLCPPEQVSTQWAYQAWDAHHATAGQAGRSEESPNFQKNAAQCLTSLSLGAKEFVFQQSYIANTFECVVFEAYPPLREYKEELLKSGANAAVLSGSGASLVGLFKDAAAAQRAESLFCKQGLRVYRLEL